jgi:hypothetical protein
MACHVTIGGGGLMKRPDENIMSSAAASRQRHAAPTREVMPMVGARDSASRLKVAATHAAGPGQLPHRQVCVSLACRMELAPSTDESRGALPCLFCAKLESVPSQIK